MVNEKRSYFWNTLSGAINAGQSVIILIFVSWFYGTYEAGIFSIAYAIATVLMVFSKFGIRNYQVTDIKEKYSFSDYFLHRCITIGITVVFLVSYLFVRLGTYTLDKCLVILFICVWKMIDTMEDVFYGMYQQKKKLDVAAYCYSLRLIISTVLFCVLCITHMSFCQLVIIVTLTSIGLAIIFIRRNYYDFDVQIVGGSIKSIKSLFLESIFICMSSTIVAYIGNVPKYLIDIYIDEEIQAIFQFIMMPSYVVMLMSMFIYQPMVRDYGEIVFRGDRKSLLSRIKKQIAYILIATALMIIMAYFLGVPLLGFLYNTDLSLYKLQMLILVLGGGLYAMSQFEMVILVTMRRQKETACVFVVAALMSIIIGSICVKLFGIWGACFVYVFTNLVVVFMLIALIHHSVKRLKEQN